MKILFKSGDGLICALFDSVTAAPFIEKFQVAGVGADCPGGMLIKECETWEEAESAVRRIYDGDGDLTKEPNIGITKKAYISGDGNIPSVFDGNASRTCTECRASEITYACKMGDYTCPNYYPANKEAVCDIADVTRRLDLLLRNTNSLPAEKWLRIKAILDEEKSLQSQ